MEVGTELDEEEVLELELEDDGGGVEVVWGVGDGVDSWWVELVVGGGVYFGVVVVGSSLGDGVGSEPESPKFQEP